MLRPSTTATTSANTTEKVKSMNAVHVEERTDRTTMLQTLLAKERADILSRLNEVRPAREDGVTGDEMDIAKSMAEVETQARLLERAESRLREIDAALNRVEAGEYGICMNCGEEIPVARLRVIPFAVYCVDCQSEIGGASGGARGPVGRSFGRFNNAEESSASAEHDTDLGLPAEEELVTVHSDSPFGPEEGELDLETLPRRKRGRPRKNPL